jgi:hypothetical protein
LKEAYFFREAILSGGEITAAADQKIGGEIKVTWRSAADQVDTYKVYYLKAGKGAMLSKEVKASTACTTAGATNECSTIVSGLTNNTPYVFKVSVISVNQTESQLSAEKTATPTDQTPPATPNWLEMSLIASSTIKFSWSKNNDDTAFYRLYHGVNPGLYGESFDSSKSADSLSFPADQFPADYNYFALSAIDGYGNESAKFGEIVDYSGAGYPNVYGLKPCNMILGYSQGGFTGMATCAYLTSGCTYDTSDCQMD